MGSLNRRSFLVGAAGSLGVGALGGCASQVRVDPSPRPPGLDRRHALHRSTATAWRHDPTTAAATVAAFNVNGTGRLDLTRLLREVTERLGAVAPGSLGGRTSRPGEPEVTLAAGASLFDQRFGLGGRRPARLITMPAFPNDALDADHCHGDLLLQVCGERREQVLRVSEYLRRHTARMMAPRWSMVGFRPENQVTPAGVATTQNLFGFREGIGNPDPGNQALMNQLVWVRPGGDEPAWTAGGTYQVVRLIRFATELWDAEPVERQEDVFGRHKQSGAPLAGNREDQVPNFAVDPDGRITPLDAHIRRANPHTPQTEANRILRRSYSYRRGRDTTGQPDEGLIFICFQQDLERGFATVQRRLRGEALEKYVLPFGGGYFFVLPAAPPGGYLGQQLLEAAD